MCVLCIPPLLYALAEVCSSAWGSVHLEVMRTSFSIGWSVMHCHWFVQVQRLQVVPTAQLVQTMAFQTQREGGLTQLVRCPQHHAEVDGLVGICMYVHVMYVLACVVADSVSSVYSVRVSPVVPVPVPVVIGPKCKSCASLLSCSMCVVCTPLHWVRVVHLSSPVVCA